MKHKITRYDLEKSYRFNEYNETISYAKQHRNVKGVKEQMEKLNGEKDNYVKSIKKIVEDERETEDKKYRMWEWAFKTGEISKWIMIGAVICFFTGIIFEKALPRMLANILALCSVLALLMFFAFIMAKACAWFFGELYKKYINKVMGMTGALNTVFMRTAQKYYEEIDGLYLLSLDPTHREMVEMRRDQERHHQEMLRLEKERVRSEAERAKEQRRMSEMQERMLAIEEEREQRYWKNRY